jgi:hypothetical protein
MDAWSRTSFWGVTTLALEPVDPVPAVVLPPVAAEPAVAAAGDVVPAPTEVPFVPPEFDEVPEPAVPVPLPEPAEADPEPDPDDPSADVSAVRS